MIEFIIISSINPHNTQKLKINQNNTFKYMAHKIISIIGDDVAIMYNDKYIGSYYKFEETLIKYFNNDNGNNKEYKIYVNTILNVPYYMLLGYQLALHKYLCDIKLMLSEFTDQLTYPLWKETMICPINQLLLGMYKKEKSGESYVLDMFDNSAHNLVVVFGKNIKNNKTYICNKFALINFLNETSRMPIELYQYNNPLVVAFILNIITAEGKEKLTFLNIDEYDHYIFQYKIIKKIKILNTFKKKIGCFKLIVTINNVVHEEILICDIQKAISYISKKFNSDIFKNKLLNTNMAKILECGYIDNKQLIKLIPINLKFI